MGTLTIHSLDPAVEKRIRQKSRKENKSLNQTLKELLAVSVGLPVCPSPDHQEDFTEFAGVWSEADQQEFEAAAACFEKVDEEDWR